MISTGYIICYLQQQNLHGDWVRAEGRLLAHCTTCEESFELNFRGSTKQLYIAVDGYYQTPSLGDKQ